MRGQTFGFMTGLVALSVVGCSPGASPAENASDAADLNPRAQLLLCSQSNKAAIASLEGEDFDFAKATLDRAANDCRAAGDTVLSVGTNAQSAELTRAGFAVRNMADALDDLSAALDQARVAPGSPEVKAAANKAMKKYLKAAADLKRAMGKPA